MANNSRLGSSILLWLSGASLRITVLAIAPVIPLIQRDLNMSGTVSRGAADDVAVLFITTIVMSIGIAVAQPTLAVLVRDWLPNDIGFGTATYANGLIVGAIIPISLMIPIVMPLSIDSWRLAIAVWSVPVLLVVGLLLLFAPKTSRNRVLDVLGRDSWASLDYNLIWRIGLIFGANNGIFFG